MHTAAHTCNHRPRVLSMFSRDTEKIFPVTLHKHPAHLALETRCTWTPIRGLWDLTYANLPSRKQGLTVTIDFFLKTNISSGWGLFMSCLWVCYMYLLRSFSHSLPPYHAGIPAGLAPVSPACISVSRDTKQNVFHAVAGWKLSVHPTPFLMGTCKVRTSTFE